MMPTGPASLLSISVPGHAPLTAWIDVKPQAPALFTWQTGTTDSSKYAVAQHSDFSNVGKAGLFPQQSSSFTTPAKPGEVIVLYASGLGATSTSGTFGSIADKPYSVAGTVTATVGGTNAKVLYSGLVQGLADIYQINCQLPSSLPDGDVQIVVSVNGTLSASALVTIRNQ
jgi:uncharacterized protein (TIGR03437 family)